MIKFVLIASPRLLCFSKYFEVVDKKGSSFLEQEIIKKCSARSDDECSFLEFKGYSLIYRRYQLVTVVISTDGEENEMAVFEFIQLFTDALTSYFGKLSRIAVQSCKVRVSRSSVGFASMVFKNSFVSATIRAANIVCLPEEVLIGISYTPGESR